MRYPLITVLFVLVDITGAADGAAIAPRSATSYQTDAITIPQMLAYQGKLTDTFGLPVADTTYSVAFRLYTQPTGGSPFWNETQTVETRGGLFSTLLGSVTPIGSMPDAGAAYLGMAVGWGLELVPRLRIVSAAYSYLAARAANADLLQGKDTTGLDGRYVNEGQANSVTSAMITNGTIVASDLGQMGAGTGQVMKWTGSAWAPRNDSIGGGGGGGVTSVAQSTGINCTPNPITTTGTVALNTGYTDSRYVNVTGDSMSGMLRIGNQLRVHDKAALGYSCYNGGAAAFCAGYGNNAGGNYASVTGGEDNSAGGRYSHVSGGSENQASGLWATVGGGNTGEATDTAATIAGGRGNFADAAYATVGGGQGNMASVRFATVAGGDNNSADSNYASVVGGRSNTASGNRSFVGGGSLNEATGYISVVAGGGSGAASGQGSFVGGGIGNEAVGLYATAVGGDNNNADSSYTMVGGGRYNRARGRYATIAGGYDNRAESTYATVGGGYTSRAEGRGATAGGGYNSVARGQYSTVAGGYASIATGQYGTVSGGYDNEASGSSATVTGGSRNYARGSTSQAGGNRAYANHAGCLVWSDSTYHTRDSVYTTGNNQFRVRARGGTWFFSNLGMTTGAYLAPGSNSWQSACDSATKEDFRDVDRQELLQKVAALRVRDYKMKDQDDGTRHIGAVAQDFHSSFGYGETETGINLPQSRRCMSRIRCWSNV
jgi:hypothetical protein